MNKTVAQRKNEVAALVEHFRKNIEFFKSPQYREAQVRQDFIDPFFTALGWDVGNRQRVAPQYCEVILEESIEVEGRRKAPDYEFRVGQTPKFFVEAKKPGVAIKTDVAPAYQLRRYAWSANLPLSILTDFEELSVYECRTRPKLTDKAKIARIRYYTFEEYLDKWEEIHGLFSREAIWDGSFDRFAEQKKGRHGTGTVDMEFLKEIESWRDVLAKNIALRNPRLNIDELNSAVQRTVDRIIFLRMAEDRGMEPYEQLNNITKSKGIYKNFITRLCRNADEKYNSGLFDFSTDKLTTRIKVDDNKMQGILSGLYFPESPYEFSVLSPEILGNVYEQFLGKVIRLTKGHQAKVEEKPEVKKAGGVYYTPAYIVDYIVKNTVGKQVEGKSPKQLKGFRVLDMACGSGSFLLGAYQYLLDHYLRYYTEVSKRKSKKAVWEHKDEWRLTTAEKKRILTEHIFGVDIDRQAVEVTKLSLLLKVLENENEGTLDKQLLFFKERALPDLGENIKCGNSLIGPDYFAGQLITDAEELKRVNPFDWEREFPDAMKAGGFDCVIGNPPYVRMETLGAAFKDYAKSHFSAFAGTADIYVYFMEHAQKLLNKHGLLGMIVSNKFLRANYGKALRDFLKRDVRIEHITDFAGLPVFSGATVRTIVLLTTPDRSDKHPMLYSPPMPVDKFYSVAGGSLSVDNAIIESTYEITHETLDQSVWSFAKRETVDLLKRIQESFMPLGKYLKGKIYFGIKTGLNKAFLIDKETRDRLLSKDPKSADLIKPLLKGQDIRKYKINFQEKYLLLIPKGWTRSNMNRAGNAEKWFHKNYPVLAQHLEPFKKAAEKRCDKGEYWWELRACDYYDEFEKPKILYPDIAKTLRFAMDENGYYTSNTAYIISSPDLYLLGLLNSNIGRFYFEKTCAGLEGKTETYLRFYGQYLEGFPIRKIDFSNRADKVLHDKIVKSVEQMLELHKQLAKEKSEHTKKLIQKQIDAADRAIDKLVYELYGLTKKEIKIVEGE